MDEFNQQNREMNMGSGKSMAKKTGRGVMIILVIIFIVLAIVWITQTGETTTVEGTVSDVSISEKTLVLTNGEIVGNEDGILERVEKSYTIKWNNRTDWLPTGVTSKNEILSPESKAQAEIKSESSDGTFQAESIRLLEKAPYR